MKIVKSESCKNSPKNLFVQDIFIWRVKRVFEKLEPIITDNFEWVQKNGKVKNGGEVLKKALDKEPDLISLVVENAFAHGKVGIANGVVEYKDGKKESWCDVIEFEGASAKKVRRIETYTKKS